MANHTAKASLAFNGCSCLKNLNVALNKLNQITPKHVPLFPNSNKGNLINLWNK